MRKRRRLDSRAQWEEVCVADWAFSKGHGIVQQGNGQFVHWEWRHKQRPKINFVGVSRIWVKVGAGGQVVKVLMRKGDLRKRKKKKKDIRREFTKFDIFKCFGKNFLRTQIFNFGPRSIFWVVRFFVLNERAKVTKFFKF